MDLELFIHGVPKGQKIKGVSGDNAYFSTFYNTSKKEFQGTPKFLIEIRNLAGVNYCYYSFLNYNKVSDYDGRPGSYIGLTIRLDKYCNDSYRIFGLLYVLYHRYVVESLFDAVKNKFLVADFTDEKIEPIQQALKNLFQMYFSERDFMNIQNQTFNIQEENTVNWSDSLSINLWDCMKKGKVLFANDYPSIEGRRIIAEWESRLAIMQSSMEQQLKAKQEELENSNRDKSSLNTELSQKNSQIQKLTNQLNETKKRNENLKKCLDKDVIHEIKNSLKQNEPKSSCENTDDIMVDSSHEKSNKGILFVLIISLLNLFVVIMAVAYYFFVSNSQSITSVEGISNQNEEEIEKLKIEKNKLEDSNKSLRDVMKPINDLINKEKEKAKIDIEGLKKDKKLKLNKVYKAEIQGLTYSIGKWEWTNNVKVSENTNTCLKFKVSEEETVSLKYKVGENTIKERVLEVDDD